MRTEAVIPAMAGTQARSVWALSSRRSTSPSFQRKLESILMLRLVLLSLSLLLLLSLLLSLLLLLSRLLLLVNPAKAGIHGLSTLYPASKSKEESLARLPIACGARVTFLCLPKEK